MPGRARQQSGRDTTWKATESRAAWDLRLSGAVSEGRVTGSEPQIFAIGTLTLDLSQGRLLSAAGDISLRPKAMRLLSVLAQSGGRVVTKDELLSEVWPDVVVTEDSLTQCVHEVREALGVDHAAMLKTVPFLNFFIPVVGCAYLTHLFHAMPWRAKAASPR